MPSGVYPRPSVEERFWAKVNKDGPIVRVDLGSCWVWTGAQAGRGYGVAVIDNENVYAHRLAWFLEHGYWPKDCVLHKCDNPICVRHSHLFEGTKQDNSRDMVLKGRQKPGPGRGKSFVL